MAYQSHDANIIKAALEAVIVRRGRAGPGLSDDEARAALEALARLVRAYLPEGEPMRRLQRGSDENPLLPFARHLLSCDQVVISDHCACGLAQARRPSRLGS